MSGNLKTIKIQNLVTKPKYAEERRVTIQTIYNWIKEGKVKVVEFMGHEIVAYFQGL